MKKLIVIFVLLFSFCMASVLDESYKIYPKDADSLFMNVLSVLNQSDRFEISEIQSKNGYILFLYGSRYYLLTLTKRYQNQTEIKILPQNSEFSQGSNVAKYIFGLLDETLKNQPMEPVK